MSQRHAEKTMPHMFVHQYGGICSVNKRSYGHTALSYSVTKISKTTRSPSDISGKCVRFEKLLGIGNLIDYFRSP